MVPFSMEPILQKESLVNVLTIIILYLLLTALLQAVEVVFGIKRRYNGMSKLVLL